jgi:hypothetical protein
LLGKYDDARSDVDFIQISDAMNVRRYGFGVGVSSFVDKRDELALDSFRADSVSVPRMKVTFSFSLPASWSPPGA